MPITVDVGIFRKGIFWNCSHFIIIIY